MISTRAAVIVSSVLGFVLVLSLHLTHSPVQLAATTTSTSTTTTSVGSTTTSSPSTTTTTSGATVSAVGPAEQYGYGTVSVKVTEQGGRIVDVSVASLSTAESYSQQLAQQAIPLLRQEVLSAQSASVNSISGASFTAQAYLSSVQGALDSLKS